MSREKDALRIIHGLHGELKGKYLDKVKKYKNECGCTLGGIMSTVSILCCIIFFILNGTDITIFKFLQRIMLSLLVMIMAGIAGKMTGIALARIKLFFLYKSVLTKQIQTAYGNM